MRSIALGPVPSLVLTTWSSVTVPSLVDGTTILFKPSMSLRNEFIALTRTSYCSVPALKVVASCPATKIFKACEISPTRTPKSAARTRSTTSWTSGLPLIKVESTSTASGTCFNLSTIFAEISSSLFKSGPPTRNCTLALRKPPPENAATCWTAVRSVSGLNSGFCKSSRASTIICSCDFARSPMSESLT